MNEQEEFEFRARAEAESHITPPDPGFMKVAGNAAATAAASAPDFWTNVATGPGAGALGTVAKGVAAGVNYLRGNEQALDQVQRPARPNLARKALEKVGIIRAENEPQTGPQRILDTAVQAGVNTMLAPAQSLGQVAVNAGMGLLSGGAAGVTKELTKPILGETGSNIASTVVGMTTPLGLSRLYAPGTKSILTAEGNENLQAARDAGYVVQPSSVKPSFGTSKAEWMAGSGAIRNEAALKNQPVTNELAAQAVGLPKGTPVTPDSLKSVRSGAEQVYQEVANLSPRSKSALEAMKQARADASAYYKSYYSPMSPADPSVLQKAKALDNKANLYERVIEKEASRLSPGTNLMDRFRESRTLIAKTYDVERALLEDGNVSAKILGEMLDKGKPLSGELKVIGKFAQTFPYAARDQRMIPPPESSATNMMVAGAGLTTAAAAAASGNIPGMLAGAAMAGGPFLRAPMRSGLLSNMYQNRLLREPATYNIAAIRGGLVGKSLMDYHDEVFK